MLSVLASILLSIQSPISVKVSNVNNNTPMTAGDGSCIMIHIWREPGKPTQGCTAASKENIVSLLKWLDPAKNPKMVQITKEGYPQMKAWFGLPELDL